MKTAISFITFTLLGISVASAHAGSMGNLQINVSPYDFRDVYINNSKETAVEFDIDLAIGAFDLENFDSFAYCIEISQGISGGTMYENYSFTSLSELDSDIFYDVAWLVDQYAPGDNYEDIRYDYKNNNEAGALQGLIWEIVDSSSTVTALQNNNMVDLFYYYKGGLADVLWTESLKTYLSANYMIAQHETAQDLIVKIVQPTPTPEPTTMLLFGTGIAGLIGLRRKKQLK